MGNPPIPDVEIFIVIKWMMVVVISAGLAQLASLWVKRKWYGSEKYSRRDDADTRGWINRFLEMQQQYTEATVALRDEMHRILEALNDNGNAIRDFTKSAECKYETHGGRK